MQTELFEKTHIGPAFHLMWDSFPTVVMLIRKDRTIVDVNDIGKQLGVVPGTKRFALTGECQTQENCLANEALAQRRAMNIAVLQAIDAITLAVAPRVTCRTVVSATPSIPIVIGNARQVAQKVTGSALVRIVSCIDSRVGISSVTGGFRFARGASRGGAIARSAVATSDTGGSPFARAAFPVPAAARPPPRPPEPFPSLAGHHPAAQR